jgi:hypothetical protein
LGRHAATEQDGTPLRERLLRQALGVARVPELVAERRL